MFCQLPRPVSQGYRTVLLTAFLIGIANPAVAQSTSYGSATDNVVINWGALGGGVSQPTTGLSGYNAPPSAVVAPQTGGLIFPGPQTPQSQLHVATPGGNITLRNPGTASAPPPRQATARNVTPPPPSSSSAPAPASAPPAPAQVAAAPPTPVPSAPTAPAAAPAPTPEPDPAPAPAAAAPASAPPPPPVPAASAPPPPPAPTQTAAAPPPPPPAPEPESNETAPSEQASLPPASADTPAQVLFNNDDTRLSADGQAALGPVIEALGQSDTLRVQLMAYASGEDLTASRARRISLSRALSVRSYLIENGVRSTRIDVRALGDKAESDPRNRVDVNVVER